MHNTNFLIDFIQDTKKQIVRATISDKIIKDGLISFVDKQTALTKQINKNAIDFTKFYLDEIFVK